MPATRLLRAFSRCPPGHPPIHFATVRDGAAVTNFGVSEGLDLRNIHEITPEEVEANLTAVWRRRQPLYELPANAMMLDFNPEFAKLHRWGSDCYGRPDPENIVILACQNMHSYMMQGWETGIWNSFHTLTGQGMSVPQIMEVVLFSQLYAGMRGLGHVHRAAGDFLTVFDEPKQAPTFPESWAADPEAFKCGLDFSTRELTDDDRRNMTNWYERTIGFVPESIQVAMRYHPEFAKVHRAKWEVAIKTMPKQIAPMLMIRHHMITGLEEGLREAVLLARAWDVEPKWIMRAISASAFFFTSFEGLYTAHRAVGDLLEEWDYRVPTREA